MPKRTVSLSLYRVTMLGLAALSLIACAGIMPGATPDQTSLGDRLYADVVEYSDMGIHRTGTAVDWQTVEWFSERLEKMGGDVHLERFAFDRFDGRSRVILNGREIESTPLYYEGVGHVRTDRPFVASANVLYSHLNSRSLIDTIDRARSQGAEVAVIATENSLGTLQVPNRKPELGSGLPVILVPGRYAEALQQGDVQVEFDAQIVPGESANVIARFGRHSGAPIVLSTPLSGWFECAAERGTGIAITLALAESLSRDYNVLVTGSPGHELLNHIGLEDYLRNNEIEAALVLHLGANLALAGKAPGSGELRLVPDASHPDNRLYQARRRALLRMNDAVAPQVTQALAQAELVPTLNPPTWFGEGALWANAVDAPLMSFVGIGPAFHSPLDLPEHTTSPALLEQVSRSVEQAVRSFMEHSPPH